MKLMWFLPIVAALVLGSAGVPAEKKAEEALTHIQNILADNTLDTRDFPAEMTLAQLLALVEAKLPPGQKVAFKMDEAAFGKQLPRVGGAKLKFPALPKASVAAVLHRALAQIEDADYALRPTGVVITRPRLTAHAAEYDLRNILPALVSLLPGLRAESPELYRDLKPGDGAEIVVRLVANSVALKPWETLEVRNGVRLIATVSPTRHGEIANLLDALRHMTGVAVVMNARLYEVDRAFYSQQVAPLFAPAVGMNPPTVVAIEEQLFRKIAGQKLLVESENGKLRPREETGFLSRQSAFRYTTAQGTGTGTGLAGVSFAVRPLVSADRRFLRLHLTQRVAQLTSIDRVKTLDLATGKNIEIEVPNLRKTSVTGMVQLPDAGAFLMPVTYRPAGKENADKVWLLVARPFIWIEEEVQELRKGGDDLTPRAIWDSAVPKAEMPGEVPRFPGRERMRQW